MMLVVLGSLCAFAVQAVRGDWEDTYAGGWAP
jgi:hypothetical protein